VVVLLCGWLVTTSAWSDVRLTLFAAAAGFVMYFMFRQRVPSAGGS
jgi:hypothetical protein